MTPIRLQKNNKFAVIAVSNPRDSGLNKSVVELGDGFWASSALPDEAIETWTGNIGRFHAEELEQANLFLWVIKPSESPDVLDEENRILARKAYRLFLGVLLGTPFFGTGRLTIITGGSINEDTRARSLRSYGRIPHTSGAPPPNLTTGKLRFAATLATAIEEHDAFPGNDRVTRALNAFRVAAEASDLGERIHQFVRVGEAFAYPWSAAQFAERIKRVCHGLAQPYLKQMYRVRSSVEHLHGLFARLPKTVRQSETKAHLRVLRLTVQAEALGRFLLSEYFSNRELWKYFVDEDSVTTFWDQTRTELKSLWPSKLGLYQVGRLFDEASARKDISQPPRF